MGMEKVRRNALTSRTTVAILAVLCVVLAALQYRWLGELANAEKERLRDGLRVSLAHVSNEFNNQLASVFSALSVHPNDVKELGRERAYANRFADWAEGNNGRAILSRFGIAIPSGGRLDLQLLNPATGEFEPAAWPLEWEESRNELTQRLKGQPVRPVPGGNSMVVSMPRFGTRAPNEPPMGEQEWMIVEYSREYLLEKLLPALIERRAINDGLVRWRLIVSSRLGDRPVLYPSGASRDPAYTIDAQVSLFETPRPTINRSQKDGRRPDLPPRESGRGEWLLEASPAGMTLETAVQRLRWRNLAVSVAILLLMLATAVLLVRSTRREQRLAEMQMNFVTSVSHELRTPLTVIRTAAFNLRGRVARNPEQVERYGTLIQDESKKLGEMVENILRYASAGAGKLIRQRERVAIENVIDESIRASSLATVGEHLVLDKRVPADLPFVLADETALVHAIRNLVDNAVKYGTENSNWIGISASESNGEIEIRVSDRGPGVPASEKSGIFDAFFRGSHALTNQIHGTGLGLNLVKKIVEAHGGSVTVESEPGQRTEFIVRIPIAPAEHQDEFAHTAR